MGNVLKVVFIDYDIWLLRYYRSLFNKHPEIIMECYESALGATERILIRGADIVVIRDYRLDFNCSAFLRMMKTRLMNVSVVVITDPNSKLQYTSADLVCSNTLAGFAEMEKFVLERNSLSQQPQQGVE